MRLAGVFLGICAAILLSTIECKCQTKTQEVKLLPVDNSQEDSSFFSFKTRLIDALKKQDAGLINEVLSENVQIGFAPDDIGRKAFEQRWLAPIAQNRLYDELMRIIDIGCTKESEDGVVYFACPYVHSRFPEELDVFEWVVAVGKDIPIYADSSTTSKVVGQLSYNLIPNNGGISRHWFAVPALEKRAAGFIERRYVYSPIDYRVTFRKEQGKWVIASFLAGD